MSRFSARRPSHQSGSLAVARAAVVLALVALPAAAQQNDKLADRARRAGEVLSELVAVPDNAPPTSLLAQATCVAVVPGVVQAGFGFGGKAGYGLASCRTPNGWSWPTYVGLKGGSFGLQIGAQSADVVLIFTNEDAARVMSRSDFTLGGEASVAAGPVGRDVSAATDYKAQAAIYSYSKSKGLFAGIKLAGTKWEIDYGANKRAFAAEPEARRGGSPTSVEQLLHTGGAAAPAIVLPFLRSLDKNVGPGMRASSAAGR